ncbi:MAG TPA: beta-phosphoglucomutase [Rhodanobacteraceae bacterium]
MPRPDDAVPPPDPWRVTHVSKGHGEASHYASVLALGNGHIGVRNGLGTSADAGRATYLAGLWERSSIDYHERFPGFARHDDTRVPVADGTTLDLHQGNDARGLAEGQWLDAEWTLDMATGLSRCVRHWRAPDGGTLTVTTERLVPWTNEPLLLIRCRILSTGYTGPLSVDSALLVDTAATGQGDDPRIGLHGAQALAASHAQADATSASLGQTARVSGIHMACLQKHRLPDDAFHFAHAVTGADGVHQWFTADIRDGQTLTLEKAVAYATGRADADNAHAALLHDAGHITEQALATPFDALITAQARRCTAFWQAADLAIDGDAASEQALRLALFHARQAVPVDSAISIPAKGLTGEGYGGHHFWDSDVYLLPALVTLAPHAARSILAFRIRTLDKARAHAREMNHARGALYPWRTIDGDECSAYFPSGSAQYHINADIAYALQLYVEVSGDDSILLEGGAEMLAETARIWLDIGSCNPRRGNAFCICQVTGPDEYKVLADNDYYTNAMAQRHLAWAARTLAWLVDQHPDQYAQLASRIGLHADEPAAWQRAADSMYLPTPDPRLGVFAQDDTFLDRPRLPATLAERTHGRPLLLDLHPLTIYRHQVCKQADVLHALALAGDGISQPRLRCNFDYYEAITTHDSTLSPPVFSLAAGRTGNTRKALKYLDDTLRIDLANSHGNTSHGVHLAAMAGSWLALTWGLGGFAGTGNEPTFAPQCPARWRGYRFGLTWRGRQLHVAVTAMQATYELISGDALDIRHYGQPLHLEPGRVQRCAIPASRLFPAAFKAFIFDLDGVLADTASLHLAAWKALAEAEGLAFDDTLAARLKGVDRMGSLDILLQASNRTCTHDEKVAMAMRKNAHYVQLIDQLGPEALLPGALQALHEIRRAGLKTALASSSRNAPHLLERLGIAPLFDFVVDAASLGHGKPDPEIFLAAAQGLGLAPEACIGVEDAAAGITAIHAAGMAAIGIGDGTELDSADITLPAMDEFDVRDFAIDTQTSTQASSLPPK